MTETYIKTFEQYFRSWDQEKVRILEQSRNITKEEIYFEYTIKKKVILRDNDTCQNEECETPDSKRTIHHIKHRRNGGKTSMKNCIVICATCHGNFNRLKKGLRLNGFYYVLHKTIKIEIKEEIIKGKKIRKENKEHHGYRITWELLCILLSFLEREYTCVTS